MQKDDNLRQHYFYGAKLLYEIVGPSFTLKLTKKDSFCLNIIQAKGSIIRAKHMDIDAHGSLAVFVGDEYSSHDRLIVMYFVHELINSSCQRDK